MSLHQTKKGNYQQNKKAAYWMGEKIFANDKFDKGLISKIYKEFTQLNIKKQKTWFKNRQRKLINVFLKKTYRWPTSTWKDARHY